MNLAFIRLFKLSGGHAAQQSPCLGRQAVAGQLWHPGRGIVRGAGSAGAATITCTHCIKLHSLGSGCMWQDCVGLHASTIPWLLCALQATGRCMWQALSTSSCAQEQQQQSAREQARAQQQSLVKVCCSGSIACTAHFGHALAGGSTLAHRLLPANAGAACLAVSSKACQAVDIQHSRTASSEASTKRPTNRR